MHNIFLYTLLHPIARPPPLLNTRFILLPLIHPGLSLIGGPRRTSISQRRLVDQCADFGEPLDKLQGEAFALVEANVAVL